MEIVKTGLPPLKKNKKEKRLTHLDPRDACSERTCDWQSLVGRVVPRCFASLHRNHAQRPVKVVDLRRGEALPQLKEHSRTNNTHSRTHNNFCNIQYI